jgi:hypothetical protein
VMTGQFPILVLCIGFCGKEGCFLCIFYNY